MGYASRQGRQFLTPQYGISIASRASIRRPARCGMADPHNGPGRIHWRCPRPTARCGSRRPVPRSRPLTRRPTRSPNIRTTGASTPSRCIPTARSADRRAHPLRSEDGKVHPYYRSAERLRHRARQGGHRLVHRDEQDRNRRQGRSQDAAYQVRRRSATGRGIQIADDGGIGLPSSTTAASPA